MCIYIYLYFTNHHADVPYVLLLYKVLKTSNNVRVEKLILDLLFYIYVCIFKTLWECVCIYIYYTFEYIYIQTHKF